MEHKHLFPANRRIFSPICMRYIGNKTKLLPFIARALGRLAIPAGARALDAFAGTAAVGAFLKSRGATVVGCDLMTFSYVFQRAYVVADAYPRFDGLRDDPGLRAARQRSDFQALVDHRVGARATAAERASHRTTQRPGKHDAARRVRVASKATQPLDEMLVYLDHYLDPLTSFVSSHFAMQHTPVPAVAARDGVAAVRTSRAGRARIGVAAPSIASPRMYFTLDAARRIDAIRTQLHDWHTSASITGDEYYILLAALLEAADAVANTAGVYAAYIKSWQANALRGLRLRLPPITASPTVSPTAPSRSPSSRRQRCEAHLGDVSALAPTLGRFDLLYLDPPYNTRQYSAYYHVPELIATGWFGDPPVLRGKTGLLPDAKKSEWSTRAGCVAALEQLLATTNADHVVLSYNSEGIIPEAEIKRIFRAYGRPGTYRRFTRTYQRYRSDRPSASRRYTSDSVREHLYCVRLQD